MEVVVSGDSVEVTSGLVVMGYDVKVSISV